MMAAFYTDVMTFESVDVKTKKGAYSCGFEPKLLDSGHITDSSKSVDWNKEAVASWNENEYPKLKADWEACKKKLREAFRMDVEAALIFANEEITTARAKRIYELAEEYGTAAYVDACNSDSCSACLDVFVHIACVAGQLAEIFAV